MTKVRINLTVGKSASRASVSRVNSAVHESLVQVRAAREALLRRAARERRRARLVAAGVLGAALLPVYLLVGRPGHVEGRRAVATASAAAAPAFLAASGPAAPTPSAPVAPAPVAPAPAVSAPEVPAAVPHEPTADARACDDAFQARRWRAMAEPCAAAYTQTPSATLALRAAQSHHARGQLEDARAWAERVLALDAGRAEAFVLIARAALRAGDAEAARRAYRRYLSLAPRGWHADEALAGTSP